MEDYSVPNSTEFLEDPLSPKEFTGADGDWFTMIAHVIILLVGVPGNCLVLRVYWTKPQKTSTHVLIMALAWADLAVCLLRWRRSSVEALLLAGGGIPTFLNITWAFVTTFAATSVLITAMIAADRYDCVCRPHNRFFTKRRAELAVCIALLFSVVINIPAFIAMATDPSNALLRKLVLAFQVLCYVTALLMIAVCYGLVYVTIRRHVRVGVLSNSNTGRGGYGGDGPRLGDDSTVAYLGASKTCDTDVSVVSMTTCITAQPNTSSPKKTTDAPSSSGPGIPGSSPEGKPQKPPLQPTQTVVRNGLSAEKDGPANGQRNPRQRLDNGGRAKKVKVVSLQRKTTRMLFITSVVFLLTWLPYWTKVTLEFVAFGGASISPTFLSLLTKSTFFLFVNNAVNPLIYGIANRRFRQDCKEVLRKIRFC